MKRYLVAVFTAFLSVSFLFSTAANAANVGRLSGADRFGTAVSISKHAWNAGNAKTVYVANGFSVADALVAGTLTGGPILLTPKDKVLPAVSAEIKRLGNPKIVVIGGEAVVSSSVAKAYNGGRVPTRLSGANRFDTSVAVSKYQFEKGAKKTYVTSGMDAPDGVVGGTLTDGPILLVNPKLGPTKAVRDEISRLDRLGAGSVVRLGSNDLRMGVNGTLGGATRYATAVSIAKLAFSGSASTVYLARGDVFADAIAGGALLDGPILLVGRDNLPAEVSSYLKSKKPGKVIALGGINSVSDRVLNAAKSAAEKSASSVTPSAKPTPTVTVKPAPTPTKPAPTPTPTPSKPSFVPCGYDSFGEPIDCSVTPVLSTVVGYWVIDTRCGVELNCQRANTPLEVAAFGGTIPKPGDKYIDEDQVGGGVVASKPTNKAYEVIAPDHMTQFNAFRAEKGVRPVKTLLSKTQDGYTAAGFGGYAQVWANKLAAGGGDVLTPEQAHSKNEDQAAWWDSNYPHADPKNSWVVGEVVAGNGNYFDSIASIHQWYGSAGHRPAVISQNPYWSIGMARNSYGHLWVVGHTARLGNSTGSRDIEYQPLAEQMQLTFDYEGPENENEYQPLR